MGGRPPIHWGKRYWSKVKKTDDCWPWTGAKTAKGYGRFWKDGKRQAAHRLAYETAYGPIEEGLLICHRCNNSLCVRPEHLLKGTHQDSLDNMVRKGRRRPKHKELTYWDVQEIQRKLADLERKDKLSSGEDDENEK